MDNSESTGFELKVRAFDYNPANIFLPQQIQSDDYSRMSILSDLLDTQARDKLVSTFDSKEFEPYNYRMRNEYDVELRKGGLQHQEIGNSKGQFPQRASMSLGIGSAQGITEGQRILEEEIDRYQQQVSQLKTQVSQLETMLQQTEEEKRELQSRLRDAEPHLTRCIAQTNAVNQEMAIEQRVTGEIKRRSLEGHKSSVEFHFERMPSGLYQDMPITTINDLVDNGITKYSQQHLLRLVSQEDNKIPYHRINRQIVLTASSVARILEIQHDREIRRLEIGGRKAGAATGQRPPRRKNLQPARGA
jgi:hypothetical protein